jgi:hypothetical protein
MSSQAEAEGEEPSRLGYTQLLGSATHHLQINCLADLQPPETWSEQLEDPVGFAQIDEDDSSFVRENLLIDNDSLLVRLPKLDGCLDYVEDLDEFEIEMIKDELPKLTRDYGMNMFDSEWGDIQLEHEFSSCENMHGEADRECLPSSEDFTRDIQLGNLATPEESNTIYEGTFTTALKAGRHQPFDKLKTVCHIGLPYNMRGNNNLPTGNRSGSFQLPFRACNTTVFPIYAIFTTGKQLQDTCSQT